MKLSLASVLTLLLGCPAAVVGGEPPPLEKTLTLPAQTPSPGAHFAILASGDGGWAEMDRELACRLAAADVPVVGWNSRAYYWTRRTPEEAAQDLGRLITRFRAEWHRPKVLLIGYSRGADVLPFLVSRLRLEDRAFVHSVVLLGPGEQVDFEIHLTDYLRDSNPRTALPVPAEIGRLRGLPVLVIYGDEDKSSCGAALPANVGRIVAVPGDHHFNRDYDRLGQLIQEFVRSTASGTKETPNREQIGDH
jgi:type IV secretory pathway VirJ component